MAKNNIHIFGTDPRGTSYGIYALSERLGIDPLYHWTGYTPEKHNPLDVKLGTLTQGTPAIR